MNGGSSLIEQAKKLFDRLDGLPVADRIEAINELRCLLHEKSPMRGEPVDCVLWVASERVHSNDYNPNTVAAQEMALLKHSIEVDGFTQPIVAFDTGSVLEVVDGFHRSRVGKEVSGIRARLSGYLPVVIVNQERDNRRDRIAATIRHNRARGVHGVAAMSDIVIELARRNWDDVKIGLELGMCPDEVLRLKQTTGIAELFKGGDFSQAWEPE